MGVYGISEGATEDPKINLVWRFEELSYFINIKMQRRRCQNVREILEKAKRIQQAKNEKNNVTCSGPAPGTTTRAALCGVQMSLQVRDAADAAAGTTATDCRKNNVTCSGPAPGTTARAALCGVQMRLQARDAADAAAGTAAVRDAGRGTAGHAAVSNKSHAVHETNSISNVEDTINIISDPVQSTDPDPVSGGRSTDKIAKEMLVDESLRFDSGYNVSSTNSVMKTHVVQIAKRRKRDDEQGFIYDIDYGGDMVQQWNRVVSIREFASILVIGVVSSVGFGRDLRMDVKLDFLF